MTWIQKLQKIELRFKEIESLLAQPDVASDSYQVKKLHQEHKELGEIIKSYVELKSIEQQIRDAEDIYKEHSGELAQLAFEEIQILQNKKEFFEKDIFLKLQPQDPYDGRNIILEIRAGAGGQEASLFAAELFRAYTRFAEGKGWKLELLSVSESELGGFREVIGQIEGTSVYKHLKYESGVHRVQRIPATESQGRVHTSTVTVAILPEAEEVDVDIKLSDLRIDTYRSGGAGGQHVNKTDSAVRITHMPSGIVVSCQDERSQIKNKNKAMKVLRSRLFDLALVAREESMALDRKKQVGTGDRSERIRTYNFPQARVTDHRIPVTTHHIQEFMNGHMQDMLDLVQNHFNGLDKTTS